MESDLQLRPITPDDFDRIVDMTRGNFASTDYIPYVFNSWLTNPGYHFMGLELNEQLIGIQNVRWTDGNKTVWLEGFRIHPEFRRKGYGTQFHQLIVKYSKEILKAQRLRLSSCTNLKESIKIVEAGGSKIIDKMHYYFTRDLIQAQTKVFEVEGLNSFQNSNKNVSLSIISFQELVSLLLELDPETREELVPRNDIHFNWSTYELCEQNFKTLQGLIQIIFCERDESGKLISFSIGADTILDSNDHFVWSTTIYTLDKHSFFTHLKEHMKAGNERKRTDIEVFWKTQLNNIMDELQLTPYIEPFYDGTFYLLYEKPFLEQEIV